MEGDGWMDGEFRLAGVSVLSGNKVNPKRLEGLFLLAVQTGDVTGMVC